MNLQFYRLQPLTGWAQKLGFLSNWDFATTARGSDACVPVPRAQLCHRRRERSSDVASLSRRIGATRSDLHPTTPLIAAAQLPQHPLYRFITLESIRWFFPPPLNKYSLQYSKAKVIYEAALAALMPLQVDIGFSQQCQHRPSAPIWH